MGRAIVGEPSVFLFDEPLSNLDAKLRVQMRLEIRQLQRQLGITSLYVTHDQVEAMTMADRMIVMNNGNAEQIGTPLEVYQKPETLFAAQFIGSPAMNIFDAEIQNGCLILNGLALTEVSLPDGKVALGIRPEHLVPSVSGPIKVSLNNAEPLGANTLLYGNIKSSNEDITISMPGVHEISENEGDKSFGVEKAKIHLFCPSSGRRL